MNAIDAALYTRLQAGTALTALLAGTTAIYYQGETPENQTLPYVTFYPQSGGEDNQTQGRMRTYLYQVRGVAYSKALAGSIDTQIDALIHGANLAPAGWTNNYWTARETDINFVEYEPSGRAIFTAGAIYRIRISKTS